MIINNISIQRNYGFKEAKSKTGFSATSKQLKTFLDTNKEGIVLEKMPKKEGVSNVLFLATEEARQNFNHYDNPKMWGSVTNEKGQAVIGYGETDAQAFKKLAENCGDTIKFTKSVKLY